MVNVAQNAAAASALSGGGMAATTRTSFIYLGAAGSSPLVRAMRCGFGSVARPSPWPGSPIVTVLDPPRVEFLLKMQRAVARLEAGSEPYVPSPCPHSRRGRQSDADATGRGGRRRRSRRVVGGFTAVDALRALAGNAAREHAGQPAYYVVPLTLGSAPSPRFRSK